MGDTKEPPKEPGDGAQEVNSGVEQANRISKTTQKISKDLADISQWLEAELAEIRTRATEIAERQRAEKLQTVSEAKRAFFISAVLLTGGLVLLLGTILLLQWTHVGSSAGAIVTHSVAGEGSPSNTLTNIHWPVSALGWAAAVAFLGFAAAIGVVVIATGTSLSRIANGDT